MAGSAAGVTVRAFSSEESISAGAVWRGHKTRAIFDRHNIVSGADLANASEKLYQYLQNGAESQKVVVISSAIQQRLPVAH